MVCSFVCSVRLINPPPAVVWMVVYLQSLISPQHSSMHNNNSMPAGLTLFPPLLCGGRGVHPNHSPMGPFIEGPFPRPDTFSKTPYHNGITTLLR